MQVRDSHSTSLQRLLSPKMQDAHLEPPFPEVPLHSRRKAPVIAGIDIKKEKLAIFSRENPHNSPAKIVEPERDIPGTTAIPCTIPNIMAW